MGAISSYHLIAVDGGGTGCRAAVAAADGRVLGRGTAGPANVATDADGAIGNVRAAIAAALAQAGLDAEAMQRCQAHIGLAGMLSMPMADRVAKAVGLPRCQVTDDRAIAVEGALGPRDGVVLGIGTGSLMAARRAGLLRGINGWGFHVSDQASGAWLGRALLERVLLCHDGMEGHSPLTRDTLASFGGPPGIVGFAATAGTADYATHAPAILDAAEAGDAAGLALVRSGAAFLSRALEALKFGEADVLCLTGGVGPRYAPYFDSEIRARIVDPAGTALDGALALARKAGRDST